MRNWRVLSIDPLGDGRYSVVYLLDERERKTAVVNSGLNLEASIAGVGKLIAELPPWKRPPIGNRVF